MENLLQDVQNILNKYAFEFNTIETRNLIYQELKKFFNDDYLFSIKPLDPINIINENYFKSSELNFVDFGINDDRGCAQIGVKISSNEPISLPDFISDLLIMSGKY